ncbi:aminotransferase class IV [Bacteroidota bacterium]
MNQYVCLNGDFHKADKPHIFLANRAFNYGDAFFETMHACGTRVQFLEDHFERIQKSMERLKMNAPSYFNIEFLEKKISKLLNLNKIFGGARVKLNIYREAEGYYMPAGNEFGFAIGATHLENDDYKLNKRGLMLGVYEEMKKPLNRLSPVKTSNSLIYVMAGIYCKEKKFNDCMILNENDAVCEAISSNIFLVQHNNIYTPVLADGCVNGIMRKNIISIAEHMGYKVIKAGNINPDDLVFVDEIFLTNSISGIRWVVAYRDKRYFNTVSSKLIQNLNQIAFRR